MTRLDFADWVADRLGLNLRNRLRAYIVAERILPRRMFRGGRT
jgi:hypothetical protein